MKTLMSRNQVAAERCGAEDALRMAFFEHVDGRDRRLLRRERKGMMRHKVLVETHHAITIADSMVM